MADNVRSGDAGREGPAKGDRPAGRGALSSHRVAFASLCVTLFGVGVANASFGPLLPGLAARSGLPLAQAGLIISFVFLGVGVANPIAGALSDRFGRGPVLIFGTLCTVVFAAGIGASRSVPLLLGLSFGIGMGGGTVVLGTNLLVVDLFRERSVPAVNLLNVFFGAGAVTGPLVASLAFRWWRTALPALWLAALLVLTQLPLLLMLQRRVFSTLRGAGHGAEAASAGTSTPVETPRRSIFGTPLIWVFGAVMLFDFGVEQGLNGWTAVYMHRSTGLRMADASLVLSGFWIAYTIGRLTAATIGGRVSPKALLRGSLLVAAAGVALINLRSGALFFSTAGFMLMGLGFGPVFPTVVSRIGGAFSRNAGAATGVVLLIGTAGGVFFSWLLGFVLEGSGPVSTAHVLILMLVAIVISLVTVDIVERAAGRPVRAGNR